MKLVFIILGALITTTPTFAAEDQKPVQVVCAEKAQTAAEALFKLNTQEVDFTSKAELVDLSHIEEGGYEVYDVIFTAKDITYSPYRMTTNIDACTVISFEMPFAN